MGIAYAYWNAQVTPTVWSAIAYFSISLSLNVLLTLMIVIRLILYTRNTHAALGIAGIDELCKAIVAMLVESCALCAVSSLLVIGSWGAGSSIAGGFISILVETQVRQSMGSNLQGG